MPARICTIEAPAKINLHLEIGERRSDGFHGLESLFASLALGDTLRFERLGREAGPENEGGQFSINWESLSREVISREKNLILKALTLFRQRTGFKSALKIRLDKRIPLGSGLGGGSSDAASTLLALNLLAGTALSMVELEEMAVILGSDVPFFLHGGSAFVSGRGELVDPVKSPEGLWVVLAKPPFSSDTADAYRLLDQARAHREESGGKPGNMPVKEKLSKKALIQALGGDPASWPFSNDFLPIFLDTKDGAQDPKADGLRSVLETLLEMGSLFSGLSGAGFSCFGVFSLKEAAERAEKELSMHGNYARLTFFLAQKADPVLEY